MRTFQGIRILRQKNMIIVGLMILHLTTICTRTFASEEQMVSLKMLDGSCSRVQKSLQGTSSGIERADAVLSPTKQASIQADGTGGGSGQVAAIFTNYIAYSVGSYPEAVAVGDLNGDGRADVAMTTSLYHTDPINDGKVFIFLQNDRGELNVPLKYDAGNAKSVAIADVNNDGRNDVVIGNEVGVRVFLQDNEGSLGLPIDYSSDNAFKICTGDFNNDGLTDVAGIGWATRIADVFLQSTNGGLNLPQHYSVYYEGYDDMETGDFNGDGLTDIAITSGQGTWGLGVLIQSNATFASEFYNRDYELYGLGVGDLRGDGKARIAVSYGDNPPSSGIDILSLAPTGGLSSDATYASYDRPQPVAIADVNCDGLPDVITLHGEYQRAGVYYQNANGTLQGEQLYTVPYATYYNPQGLAVADVNSDGMSDIVLADYNHGLVVLRNQQTGIEPSAGPIEGGTMVTILGGNLSSGTDVTNVTLCGVAATIVTQSAWRVVVQTGATPAPTNGDVVVYSSRNGNVMRKGAFTYATTTPVVATRSVSNVTATSATGTGEVLSDSGTPVTERGLCWGSSPYPTVFDSVAFSGSGTGVFTGVALTNLSPGTVYHARAWARNMASTDAYGDDVSFRTHLAVMASSGAHGTIAPNGLVEILDGSNVTFTITPDSGYQVAAMLVDGSSVGATNTYTFENVTTNHTISVIFVYRLPHYVVTAAEGLHGTISPKGVIDVEEGDDISFSIIPNPGGQVADVLVDGAPVGATNSYTFQNVTTNHTINAYFCGIGPWRGANPIAGGRVHSLGLKWNGNIVAWGRNNGGQCNVPTMNNFVAVAAGGDHSMGLKWDESIVAWGNNVFDVTKVPLPNANFVAIAAGEYHALGLKSDGNIVTWGSPNYGVATVPAPNSDFVAIAAGGGHSLGLKSNGSIVAWGDGRNGETTVPVPNTNFVAVAAGGFHSVGLKSDGSIVVWGDNHSGQTNAPTPNAGFVAVAAGYWHSLGLKSDGSIVAWGRNSEYQINVPVPNTKFVAVAAGAEHSLGLKSDGSVVAWGRRSDYQCNVPSPNTNFGQPFGIVPPTGPTDGGTDMTILGYNLGNGMDVTNVTICGVPATVIAQNPMKVTVLTRMAAVPTVGDVVVYSAGYGNIVKTNAFIYFADTHTTNGTPQLWLNKYGLTNDLTDTDGDGIPAWMEFVAGTDPANRASVFVITNVQPTAMGDGGFIVQWPSVFDRTYSVDRTTNLPLEDFAPVASNLPATPPINIHTDAVSGLSNAVYRVRVRLPR